MTKTGGYLTVYAALSMAVLVSLFLAILEGARQHTVRMEAELIADIGLDSVLAEYHRELLEQYNLFFIDTSYGTSATSLTLTQEHLQQYLEKNCSMEDVVLGDLLYRDFLGLNVESVNVEKCAIATDESGYYFRSRAVEAVKDDVGLSLLESVSQWIQTVEENGLSVSDLEQEKEEADEALSAYDGTQKQVEDEWVTIDIDNPTQRLESLKSKGILNLVITDANSLSTAGVDLTGLISCRRSQGSSNQGNWGEASGETAEESWTDRLLFQEYILRYCGRFDEQLDKGVLSYQVEYIIAGKDNDVENLKSVVYRISAIREAANVLYLFSDETKCAEAEAAAYALAAAVFSPELAPLFKTTILLGWAYAESLYDVKCLLEGQKVPLLKTSDTWHFGLEGALSGLLGNGDSSKAEGTEVGLSYGDYLRILLALTPLEEQTFRVMDIVEMDIRQTKGNSAFRMDACIDRLEAEITVSSGFGYTAVIKRSKAYG